jgi:hypothetical protein
VGRKRILIDVVMMMMSFLEDLCDARELIQ